MTQKDKYIPHRRTSTEDLQWLRKQDPCVQQLFLDCLSVEGFGDAFRPLQTELSERSFRKAKKTLEDILFEFKPITEYSASNRLTIIGWQVRNIHGVHNHDYWMESTHQVTNFSVPLLRQNLPDVRQNLPPHREVLPQEEPVAFDTTAFDSSKGLKRNNNQLEAAVSFSCHDSPLQSPDLAPGSEASKMDVQEQTSLSSETLRETQTGTLYQKDLDVELSVRRKDSAPSHVKTTHTTSRSHQDAPQGVSPLQMTNPTLRDFEDGLEVFSLALAEHLMELAEVADRKGRLGELKLSDLRTTIRSVKDDVAILAVQYVIEKVDSIKNLGAYLTIALQKGYKPAQAQVAQQTTKVSQLESKPAPGRLEDFLSEENSRLFGEAGLEGRFLNLCINQLFQEWDKGDELHRTRILWWKGEQKRSMVSQ